VDPSRRRLKREGGMITAILVGDREIIARLDAMPERVRAGLARAVARLGVELQQSVQWNLSGGVLNPRTGTLRSSIDLTIEDDAASASVGTDIRYAAAQEFGFQGTVSVRAHLRHATQVFGRPIAAVQHVRPYSRRMDLPERSFLRSALEEMQPAIEAGLREAVAEAVQA
jgi:phage gpG-like protein